MSNDIELGFEAALELVREELAAWRGDLGRAKKIPVSVWDKATSLAKQYSVQSVSKALGLSYVGLKQRVTGGNGRPHRTSGLAPTFVEVKPASSPEDLTCVIELTKSSGTRMRISVKSAGCVDWCRIKEAFLGA